MKIRHGPATVSAESSSEIGHWDFREGSSISSMRESGDRPTTHSQSNRLLRESRSVMSLHQRN